MKRLRISRAAPRRGAALFIALVLALAMAGLCAALLAVNLSTKRSRVQDQGGQRAFYAAEAGLSDGFMQLTEGLIKPEVGQTVWIGSPDEPVALGNSTYWVEIQPQGSRGYLIASTGSDDRDHSRLGLVLGKKPDGFFQWAAFGADGVVLDQNAFIDSYDSAEGTWESQVTGGHDWAKENGHVGSNGDILVKSNTEIHGDARPGPGHVVDDSAPGTLITGSKEPLEEPVLLPPIVVPVATSKGSLVGSSSLTLGPGLIKYTSILMQGGTTLTIKGPAQIVADDFVMKSNSNLAFDTSDGKVELYSNGDFVLESNSTVTTSSVSAVDVTLLLNGNNLKKPGDALQLGANADFVGAIYAPNGKFKLASNFNVYGSVMCKQLDLSSNGQIHFDEALLYDGWGASDELDTKLWQRLPQP
jgi:hypothetical protein